VLLVSDPRASRSSRAGASETQIRRYGIVRLRLDGRDPAAQERFEHLKRVYD
jgi:hypothetical protein